MSLSDIAGFRLRSLGFVAGALSLAALGGCQVRPLYSDGPTGSTSIALAAIEISEADDRVEQEVRNALVFLTSRGRANRSIRNTIWRLASRTGQWACSVRARIMTMTTTTPEPAASSEGRLQPDQDRHRRDREGRQPDGRRLGRLPQQEFAKIRAVRDGENRAAKELAEIIGADLAAALGR